MHDNVKKRTVRRRFLGLDGLEPRKLMTVFAFDPGVQAEVIHEVQSVRNAIANNNTSSSDGSSVSLSQLDSALATFENDMSSSDGTGDTDVLSADLDAIAAAGLDPSSIDNVDNSSNTSGGTGPQTGGTSGTNGGADSSDSDLSPAPVAGDGPKIKIEITPPDSTQTGPKSGTPIPPPTSIGNVIRRIGWRIKNADVKISIEIPTQ
jgi:hypothetical protein